MTSVSQRIVQNYGIEVSDGVQWQGWEPGGEYTKQITLKNVQVQTQKIFYKVPSSRFFTTLYPKPVTLTCGTSFSLPVTFRPLEKDQYEDKIEFQTKDGMFSVPIKAVLPKADLVVPEGLVFGMCAINDVSEISFKLSNPSDVHTSFKWNVQEPFTLSPLTGSLAPKTSCFVKATFSPKGGFVYNGAAVCQLEGSSDQMEKCVQLEGTGKYPHIMVKLPGNGNQTTSSVNLGEALLDFGDVPVGKTVEKSIHLHNVSPVNALFQVIQPSSISNIDKVFTCSHYHGVIVPHSTMKIKVLYSPSCPGTSYVDYFEVKALGAANNCSVIKCLGRGQGPRVEFESHSVSFGEITSGGTVTRILNMTNISEVDTVFQFLVDKLNSVFAFETTSGYLEKNTIHSIVVKFRPVQPINYYRKVTCLVQNHEPLVVELFGTCHTELTKPAVLQQKHVDQYKTYIERGLSRIAPEQLNEMHSTGKVSVDENGLLTNKMTNEKELCEEDLTVEEVFFDDSSVGETAIVTPHISLDYHQLSFGKCPNIITVQQKTVNITNHTKGKVTCCWMKDFANVFLVSPDSIDILPMKTASFTVTFSPNRENQFFGTELECFVSYKSARDYRLVEDKTLTPPWCVTLSCSGETFAAMKDSFLPRVEFDTKQLVFPATTLHNTSYRTLLMVNSSPNPVHFAFDQDVTRSFRCKPSQGIFNEGYQLVMFRYEAHENKIQKFPALCLLNNEAKYKEDIFLIGSSDTPKLHIGDKAMVYFRPTCIGNVTRRSFRVQNRTRIPLSFEWMISRSVSEVVQVEPRTGTILPGECQAHTWSFCPSEENKYLMKCGLRVNVGAGVVEPKNLSPPPHQMVRIIGTGIVGKLVCVDSSINFGQITVGTSVTKQIVLFNPTDCDVSYRLVLLNNTDSRHEKPGIELSKPCQDVIPARTHTSIEICACPRQRALYTTDISYQLASPDAEKHSSLERSPLCSVTVEGVYPSLTVQDVRATGGGKNYSKVQLWKLLSIESFNSCLDSDPLPGELTYSAATRYSTGRRAALMTRAVVNFSFGSASYGSDETAVYISLLNSGSAPAEWAFLFPNDLQLELEYWAETGEYTTEELHELQTLGHHLFSIEPKNGLLAAGGAQTVVLKYQHSIVGINRLPILFKVMRGREVLLNFTGVTVENTQPFVHFMTSHMFSPVPVGLATPPVQNYTLYNGGSVDAAYEIDLSPLEKLHKDNYSCEILNCLNPTGKIAPGQKALVQWVFAPLEAKTYLVDIPVRILGCETTIVTFTGIGYDRRVMGDTMSMSDSTIDVPSRQIVRVKSQLASLSQERIQFDCVPLFTRTRRVVFLRNILSDHTISFRWLLEHPSLEKVVDIHPQFGIIKPQSSAVLNVSFFSCGSPSLHEIDVRCEITDDTLMDEYNRKLQKWYKIQEEKKHTFTITEKDIAEEKQQRMMKTKTDKMQQRISKSEGDLKKFTALPPIGSAKTSRRRPRSGNDTKEETPAGPDIVPPEPFIIHLGVAGKTLEVGDVHFYRDVLTLTSSLMRKHTLSKLTGFEDKSTLVTSSHDELRVVVEVLSVVLRGLLDDDNFHAYVKDLADDPIPYFRQFQRSTTPEQASKECEPETEDRFLYSPRVDIPVVKVCPNTPTSQSLVSSSEVNEEQTGSDQDQDNLDNEVRSSAEFASIAEDIFENTILNLVWEANLGEVNLTMRPRTIALPPSRGRNV